MRLRYCLKEGPWEIQRVVELSQKDRRAYVWRLLGHRLKRWKVVLVISARISTNSSTLPLETLLDRI